jgi:hypothetical protein
VSKPSAPRGGDGIPEKIVEIDAIDVAEWERDQHTPQAPVAGLAALVRQTVPQPVRVEPKRKGATQQMPATTQARTPQAQGSQALPPQAQAPAPQAKAPPKEPPQSQPHPPLGPSEPTKLRGRPPRPPKKAAPVAPDAELAPAAASRVPDPVPAPLPIESPRDIDPRVPAVGPNISTPQHIAPEVVQLPLHAPPSEPITTPALVIPRPFAIEAEPRLRAQPDHTPAPPAPLPLAPPALDSFEPPAHTDVPTNAVGESPEVPSLRRRPSRRVIALAAATVAAVVAVIAVAATRGSSPSRPAAPASSGAESSRVVAQVLPAPAAQPSPPAAAASATDHAAPSSTDHAAPATTPTATDRAASATDRAAANTTDHAASATDHAASATDHTASATDHAASATDRAAPEPPAPRTVPRLRDEPLASPKPHRLRSAPTYRGKRKAAKAVAIRPVAHDEPDTVEDEPSISRARVAYDAGNQALFAGDSAAAIRAYRQVLGAIPTYAPGFRGLGLAHAQQGDIGAAIMALRTYLSLAPRARDVALIKKRIAILQATSAAERSAQRSDR